MKEWQKDRVDRQRPVDLGRRSGFLASPNTGKGNSERQTAEKSCRHRNDKHLCHHCRPHNGSRYQQYGSQSECPKLTPCSNRPGRKFRRRQCEAVGGTMQRQRTLALIAVIRDGQNRRNSVTSTAERAHAPPPMVRKRQVQTFSPCRRNYDGSSGRSANCPPHSRITTVLRALLGRLAKRYSIDETICPWRSGGLAPERATASDSQ